MQGRGRGGGIQLLAGSPVPPHPSPRIKNGSVVVVVVAAAAAAAGLVAVGPPGACGECAVEAGVAQDQAPHRACSGFEVLVAPFSLLPNLHSAHRQAGCRL